MVKVLGRHDASTTSRLIINVLSVIAVDDLTSMSNAKLFFCYFLFRLIATWQLKTFFQPDEFYQALEPAHDLVFGYGFVTWEYRHAIRSIAHPLVFAIPYKVLKVFKLDSRATVLAVPKVIGSLQAAFADYYTVLFIQKYWKQAGLWAIVLTVTSPWNLFAASRTFSNSMETALTAYALYKWPFDLKNKLVNDEQFYRYLATTIKSLAAIGFAFLMRPTTALIWIIPSILQLIAHKTTFLFEAFFVAYVTLQYSVILDSFYYGTITFPLLRFLKFNTSGGANFYGVNDWHYYISQGIPSLLTGYMPFALAGTAKLTPQRIEFLAMIGFVVTMYSMLQHKEVRFIMPLSAILYGFAADAMSRYVISGSFFKRFMLFSIVSFNLGLAFYVTQVHQRGVMDLIEYVGNHQHISELTLLMPCHSTSWLATIHRPGQFRFLTCEPPLSLPLDETTSYRDEADRFYDDPHDFLQQDWRNNGSPEHVATFEASQKDVEAFWKKSGLQYRLEQRWFNSHIHDDARRKGDVLLYKLLTRQDVEYVTIGDQARNPDQDFA